MQPIFSQRLSKLRIKPLRYERSTLADRRLEKRITHNRIYVFIFIVLLVFAALIARIGYLQVVAHNHYVNISEKNRVSKQPIAPNRGRIFDKNGVLLATNHPVVNLFIDAAYLKKHGATAIEKIRGILPISEQEKTLALNGLNERKRSILLKSGLNAQQEATVLVNAYLFPWLTIERTLQRHYVEDTLFSHVIGYVGRINKQEWQKIDKNIYQAAYLIGKTNIEKTYEPVLRGTPGLSEIEINAYGQPLKKLGVVPAHNGSDMRLFLHYGLQQKAASTLKGKRGCVIAIEPSTGGILAAVSMPLFDAERFIEGISSKEYQDLQKDKDIPLFNRCFAGRYPPASTIKPFIALAALHKGIVNNTHIIWDKGWFQLENSERRYRNWRHKGHGKVNLHRALVVSNDTFFYELSHRMTINTIHSSLKEFGFGSKVGLDIDRERTGLLPSRAWKKKHRGQEWFAGDTVNIGIGQGYMLATPLQIAYATAIIANRGKRIFPRLAQSIGTDEEAQWEQPTQASKLPFSDSTMNSVIKAMQDVMYAPEGTGVSAGRKARYKIAGKTGTAQVVSIKQNEKYDTSKLQERHLDHSLFTGFAPINNPQIAIAVIIENGGGGGAVAAPIGVELINYYLDCQKSPSKSGCTPKD